MTEANEPSKNEFDMDYPAYLAEMRKTGKITTEQQKHFMSNRELKVKFEIQNMFTSGNRATYASCPRSARFYGEYDLINSIEKMLVTAQKLDESLHKIRDIDFSAFYREVQFSDPDKGINREDDYEGDHAGHHSDAECRNTLDDVAGDSRRAKRYLGAFPVPDFHSGRY